MEGNYIYPVANGETRRGRFNIYQGFGGAIVIVLGDAHTHLTHEQVTDLHIDVYGLLDFDHDKYIEYYKCYPIQ